MKIVFIIDSLGPWGKERQLVELLKGLDRKPGFQVKVVLLTDLIHYAEVYDLKSEIIIMKRKIKKDPTVFLKLYKIINEFKPDLIHSWERMCTFYALPVAKLCGVKFINGVIQNATPNPKKFNRRWLLERISFPLSDAIVSNTKAGLKAYNVKSKKGHFVHNGYDFQRLTNINTKDEIRKKFNINTTCVVGMVGKFDSRKDYKTYIKGALKILQKGKDVTFLAIGDGSNAREKISRSSFDECKNMVPSEYKKRIIFTGIQTNVESLINVFTVGVLLTNLDVHGEGVSNSIMEYMALGKPVIATNGGGTPEIVEDGVNGFLVDNNSIDDFVGKLSIFLDDTGAAKSMGKNGKELIKRKFSLELMTQNFIDLYETILKTNP